MKRLLFLIGIVLFAMIVSCEDEEKSDPLHTTLTTIFDENGSFAPDDIIWGRSYANIGEDYIYQILKTSDNNYIAVGYTSSYTLGGFDAMLVLVNSNGTILWQKAYGGSDDDEARAIVATSDGGYIIAGYTKSFARTTKDIYVIKVDGSGNLEWDKSYDNSNNDEANVILSLSDGYLIGGTTEADSGYTDIWLLKISTNGSIKWQATYQGSANEYITSILPTDSGNFIIAGFTASYGENGDALLMEIDTFGNILWQKAYGGSIYDIANDVISSGDGNYIIVGSTSSFDTNTTSSNDADYNVFVSKIDTSGNILWSKIYGTDSMPENANDIIAVSNGYVVGGYANYSSTYCDFWLFCVSSDGDSINWQKTYHKNLYNYITSVISSADGGFVFAGGSGASRNASYDAFIAKVDSTGGDIGSSANAGVSSVSLNATNTSLQYNVSTGVATDPLTQLTNAYLRVQTIY